MPVNVIRSLIPNFAVRSVTNHPSLSWKLNINRKIFKNYFEESFLKLPIWTRRHQHDFMLGNFGVFEYISLNKNKKFKTIWIPSQTVLNSWVPVVDAKGNSGLLVYRRINIIIKYVIRFKDDLSFLKRERDRSMNVFHYSLMF